LRIARLFDGECARDVISIPSLIIAETRVARASAAVHELPAGVRKTPFPTSSSQEAIMIITTAHVAPLVALIAGILILIIPRLLNYIVAIYLIIIGLAGLNSIHHFIR
jgi:hypothetical protein